MRWWLASRRAGLVAAVVLGQTVLLVIAGDVRIPVPSLLRAATVPVAAAVFIPLLVNVALQLGLEGREWRLERGAVRPIQARDAGLVLAVCAALAALAAVAALAGVELAAEGARNAFGYVGLGLLVGRLAGPRAGALAPVVYVVLLGLRIGIDERPQAVGMAAPRRRLAGRGRRRAAPLRARGSRRSRVPRGGRPPSSCGPPGRW